MNINHKVDIFSQKEVKKNGRIFLSSDSLLSPSFFLKQNQVVIYGLKNRFFLSLKEHEFI